MFRGDTATVTGVSLTLLVQSSTLVPIVAHSTDTPVEGYQTIGQRI